MSIIRLDLVTFHARLRALGAWWCLGSSNLHPAQVFAAEAA